MNGFGILTNRKRAWIALIHSVFFLGVAMSGFVARKPGILQPSLVATADLLLIMIYTSVAAILCWLVTISRGVRERLYFALCASSASFGLLRTIFGDTAVPAAQYLRVILLSSAVAMGVSILRGFSRPAPENVLAD